ncbi:MAG TPA: hypothetical protein VK797_02525 [Tepidisphaeraceae bacterium]|nr:hypothetical protein [Tepidisphaeraceae bacterium]
MGTFGDIRPALVSALVAVGLCAVTLRGTYIYDDVEIVRTDVRVLDPAKWGRLWTQPYFVDAADRLYRPLVSMSFAVENYLHGDRPWVFHLVNVLLHAGVSATVALLGVRLGGRMAGWIAGILFAVHPVHVEAVAGLVGRAESACALAMLGGILLFLGPGRISARRAAGIWVCFVVALLSKEQGILMPGFLLAALPVRYAGLRIEGADRKALQYLGVALCWTLAAYFLWRERVASLSWDRNQLDWYINPMVLSAGWDRALLPFVLLGRYTLLLVFPMHLSIDYGGWTIGWQVWPRDPYLYMGIVAAGAWCCAAVICWRKCNWAMLFCLLGLGLSYGIVGNIVALIGTIFADRLMYLPSAFFLLAAAIVLSRFPGRLVAPGVLIAAALAGMRTYTYERLWNDPVALFQQTIRLHPRSERGYALLWTFYQERQQWATALAIAKKAREIAPGRWKPYEMCIQSELGLEDFAAADADADEAIGHVPRQQRMRFIQWKDFIAKRRAKLLGH